MCIHTHTCTYIWYHAYTYIYIYTIYTYIYICMTYIFTRVTSGHAWLFRHPLLHCSLFCSCHSCLETYWHIDMVSFSFICPVTCVSSVHHPAEAEARRQDPQLISQPGRAEVGRWQKRIWYGKSRLPRRRCLALNSSCRHVQRHAHTNADWTTHVVTQVRRRVRFLQQAMLDFMRRLLSHCSQLSPGHPRRATLKLSVPPTSGQSTADWLNQAKRSVGMVVTDPCN